MRPGTFTPLQISIPAVSGDPNGEYDAPKGFLIVDVISGYLYQKTSNEGTKTGWTNMSVSLGAGANTADLLGVQISNQVTGTDAFVRQNSPELSGVTTMAGLTYLRAAAIPLDLGTITAGATATLDIAYSTFQLTASGGSYTLAVPGSMPDGDVMVYCTSTSAVDAQIVTLSNSAIRQEQSATVPTNTFTVPVGSSAKYTVWLHIRAGVVERFGVTGDNFTPATPANAVVLSPVGGVAATNMQAAVAELDTEKATLSALGAVALSNDFNDLSNKPSSNVVPLIAVYGVGTAYQLTNTSAAIVMGTTSPVLPLTIAGTYALYALVTLRMNGATFAANRTVTLKVRRTNNTAADVTNASITLDTGIVTTVTQTFARVLLPLVGYTTANMNDSLTIFADVNTVPSAGSLDVSACSLVAVKVTSFTVVDASAPTLVSAIVGTAGNTLTLVFSEIVSVGAGGSSGVAITPSGGASTATYLSGSGTSMLVYSLSRVLLSGETATTAYTQPGNGIEDVSGNDLVTYSGSAVTNNSTASGFVPAVGVFDGSNDYITTAAAGAGWVDGKTFTCSFWVNFSGGNATLQQIWRNGNGRFLIEKTTANFIRVVGATTGGTAALEILGSTALTSASGWKHIYVCIDMSDAAKRKIYVNGVAETLTVTTYTNVALDLSNANIRFGAGSTGTNKCFASFCEAWLSHSYLDDTTKFATANKPISLGPTGALPGIPPDFYWSVSWTTSPVADRSGNGNDGVVTGTITAGTPP